MNNIATLIANSILQVWGTFLHNWPFLLVGILIAVVLKLYLDPPKIAAALLRYRRAGIFGATAAAVGTPLCSCGTTAVLLGMMASTMPWAPIVAFMVSSPLTSPGELIYSAGLFGWPFAITFFTASILLGLAGGLAAEFMESRGWLKGQARFALEPSVPAAAPASCGCSGAPPKAENACGCEPVSAEKVGRANPATQNDSGTGQNEECGCSKEESGPSCSCQPEQPSKRVSLRALLSEFFTTGKRLLFMFLGFAFIGYLLNGLIPANWMTAIFGKGNIYSVAFAATLGLPLYVNSEASLPLVRALIEGGMSQGAALAFLITGAGTSFGAIAGALTIARWKIITLVVATLWAGAVAIGYLYNYLLGTGVF